MSQVKVSGKVRVLRVLRLGPTHQGEWFNPADGGRPITRLAARVDELRAEGHDIPKAEDVPGLAFGVYRMRREAAASESSIALDGLTTTTSTPPAAAAAGANELEERAGEQAQLFDMRPPPSAYVEPEAA